jgi:hypothetical protein
MSRRAYFIIAIVAGVFALAVFVLTPSLSGRTPIEFPVVTALGAMVAIIAFLRAIRRPPV